MECPDDSFALLIFSRSVVQGMSCLRGVVKSGLRNSLLGVFLSKGGARAVAGVP